MSIKSYQLTDKYINKNPQSYLGYYARGLVRLDEYFFSLYKNYPIKFGDELSKDFYKALSYMKRKDIIKYFFLSLLIERRFDVSSLTENFNRFNIDISESGYGLINNIITHFNGGNSLSSDSINVAELDYIDYLMLLVLEKNNNITILQGCNYLYESISKGRRSQVLVKTVFESTELKGHLKKEDVQNYSRYIVNTRFSDTYNWILEQNLIDDVNVHNIALVEKILAISKNDSLLKPIISKYMDYCLFNNHSVPSNFYNLRDNLSHEWKVLKLLKMGNRYHYPNMSEVVDEALKFFKTKVHYSKDEAQFYKQYGSKNDHFKLKNIFKLKVSFPIDDNLIDIKIKFKNYSKVETFRYYCNTENYYYLPDTPVEITTVYDNIALKSTDFQSIPLHDESVFDCSYAQMFLKGNDDFQKQNNRFTLFIVGKSNINIDRYNEIIFEYLLNEKNLFPNHIFEEILDVMENRSDSFDTDLKMLYSHEKIKNNLNHKTLHEFVVSNNNFEKVLEIAIKADEIGVEILFKTFYLIANKALIHKYDHRFAIMCERFVIKNTIVNSDILKYLEKAYITYGLNTDYTNSVINIVSTYSSINSEGTNRIILYNHLNSKNLDYNFLKVFMNVYNNLGPKDPFIIECVDKIIHYKSVEYTDELIDVLCEVYENNQDFMLLLEEIIYRKAIKTKLIKPEYFEKIKLFYLTNRVLNFKSLVIMSLMYRNGINGLEEFLVEALRYELKPNPHEGTLLYRTEYDSNFKSVILKGTKERHPIEVGYSEYFITRDRNGQEKKERRGLIHINKEYFIQWYPLVKNKDFRDFVGKYCLDTNIYQKDILIDYIENNNSYKVEIAYRQLIANLVSENPEQCFKYLNEYLERFTDYSFAIRMIERISNFNLDKSVEIYKTLLQHNKNNYIVKLGERLIAKGIQENKIAGLGSLLMLLNDRITLNNWEELSLSYIKLCFENEKYNENSEFKNFLFFIYEKSINTSFGTTLKSKIFEVVLNIDLAEILLQLYNIHNDLEIRDEIIKIIMSSKGSISKELKVFVFTCLRNDYQQLKIFVNKYGIDSDLGSELYLTAERYFERNRQFALDILSMISKYHDKAREVIEILNSGNHEIDGKYLIKVDENSNFCCKTSAKNIFTDEIKSVLWISPEVRGIFNDFIKNKKITSFSKKTNYYILDEEVNLKDVIHLMEYKDIFKVVRDIIDLEIGFMKNGYAFVEIYPENFILIDNVPIPININSIYEFNEENGLKFEGNLRYLIQKIKEKRRKRKRNFITLYEKDFSEIILHLIKELLIDKYSELPVIRKLVDDNKYNNLQDLRNHIDNIEKAFINLESEDMRRIMMVNNLDFYDDSAKIDVIKDALENNVYTEDLYKVILSNSDDCISLEARWKYVTDHFDGENLEIIKLMIEFLINNASKIEEEDMTKSNFVKTFIRNAFRDKHITASEVNDIKNRLRLLTVEDKSTINYYLENYQEVS